MAKSAKISWGRVIVAGLMAEVILFVIVFSLLRVFGRQAFLVSIVIGSAALPFLFALWVGRHVNSRFVLHGGLVGVVAVLFYVIVSRARPEPTLYVISHGLKLVGGMLGGFAASIRARPVGTADQPH
jgi:hypothetical protein